MEIIRYTIIDFDTHRISFSNSGVYPNCSIVTMSSLGQKKRLFKTFSVLAMGSNPKQLVTGANNSSSFAIVVTTALRREETRANLVTFL